jgi:lysophosphatidylcholine acyltransferase/lyso-PAF acetyltransferase
MIQTQQQPELELRPMLLFPEGTTSNGQMLLPFKTGAFLAGVPVLPVIIK